MDFNTTLTVYMGEKTVIVKVKKGVTDPVAWEIFHIKRLERYQR
jgi:hypothetical protein